MNLCLALLCAVGATQALASEMPMHIERLPDNPIITPSLSESIGDNINGPSLIRVPDWVESPLGRYYLYFSHHKGEFIRLAYADDLAGPWKIHEPGALHLGDSGFPTAIDKANLDPAWRARLEATGRPVEDFLYAHIASPEAVVVPETGEIRLYYHGMLPNGTQMSRVAVSRDGLDFEALPDIITRSYLRVFRHDGWYYGFAMPGVIYRSRDGLTDWQEGPTLFDTNMRHAALLPEGDILKVFWTRVGDTPEHIKLSTIDLTRDWMSWQESEATEVLRPELDWEGASLALEPSVRGAIERRVNQLRDPEIFVDESGTYLLYSVAGESGIGIARIRQAR